jgi:hypothetical protein
MLTIFSMPKAFRGHIRTIQRNAIQSWTLLSPKPEIILFGKDEGTKETAEEFGLRHVPEVAVNEHGTPLLNDLFCRAERESRARLMCYVNADILLLSDFAEAIERVSKNLSRFLLISQRINLDVTEPIVFGAEWDPSLKTRSRSSGVPGDHTAIDVFVFAKGLYPNVPDFGLGRLWFDQWLIKAAAQNGVPVVDASRVAPVIHQNHDYNHVPGGEDQVWRGEEAEHNFRLYGGVKHAFTLLEATHELTADGRIRKVRLRRQRFELQHFAWNAFVRRTVAIRNALKLRRKFWQAGHPHA